MADVVKVIDTAVGAVKSSLPKAIRTGHIQALSKDPSAGKRAESYAKVNWFVVAVTAPLFLGDSACVFETGGSRRFKPVDEQGDDVRRIFLPVSSDRLLVGTPYSACPEPDLPLLNTAITRCSFEFFAGPVSLPTDSPLLASIGQWSGVLSDSELRSIVSDFKATWPSRQKLPTAGETDRGT